MTRVIPIVAVLLALGGCDDPVQVGQGLGGAGGAVAPQPVDVDAGPPDGGEGGGLAEYRDEDFVESESNRDPFRSYSQMFKIQPTGQTVQRAVKMPTTSVDQIRLTAIISGVAQPRAMLVDPDGVGHVVARGDFICRPEVVQTGGAEGMPVTLNWRVDRIRPDQIVLTREDPSAPGRPPLTRVVPLYEENERPRGEITETGREPRTPR
jgi:type IV pilus assembly protein PilP